MEPRFRKEEDLVALKDQPESSRLEFKSSTLLKKTKNEIVDDLSKEVSAFANSEGGDMIIGIAEQKRGKGRVAGGVDDGVDLNEVSPEWLQQIIESNVSPYLPGIRVRSIPLSGRQGRAAFVISVPQGSTAHQASDKRYYARSEFQVQALPDHEIRLRMMRGHVPQARVEVVACGVVTADEEFAQRQQKLENIAARRRSGEVVLMGRGGTPSREYLDAPKRTFDEYSFRLDVANSGEVSLHDFLLSLSFDTTFDVCCGTDEVRTGQMLKYRFDEGQRKQATDDGCSVQESSPPQKKLFPGHRAAFPSETWTIRIPVDASMLESDPVLRWTVYLDNASPISGEIALAGYLPRGSPET